MDSAHEAVVPPPEEQTREYLVAEPGMSDAEIVDMFFSSDPSTRLQEVSELTSSLFGHLQHREAAWEDSIARALVVLLKVSSTYSGNHNPEWQAAKKEISRTTDLFIQGSQGLVWKLVSGLQSQASSLTSEDLISEGNYGLLDSLQRFDLSYDQRVSTFFGQRVYGAASDAMRYHSRTIRQNRRDARRVKLVRDGEIEGKTLAETAKDNDIDPDILIAAQNRILLRNTVSLDRLMTNETEVTTLAETISDPDTSVEEEALGKSELNLEELDELIETMAAKQQQDVLRRRFGLPPYKEPHTLMQIGEAHGFGEANASLKVKAALNQLYLLLPQHMKTLGETRILR